VTQKGQSRDLVRKVSVYRMMRLASICRATSSCSRAVLDGRVRFIRATVRSSSANCILRNLNSSSRARISTSPLRSICSVVPRTHSSFHFIHTHTHNGFTAVLEFVRDYLGEQVPHTSYVFTAASFLHTCFRQQTNRQTD